MEDPTTSSSSTMSSSVPVLVREPQSLLLCLRRLHETTDSLVFWNADKSMRLMMRIDADSSDHDSMAFDLGVVVPDESDDDAAIMEIMKLEHEAYADEDIYVFESFSISRFAEPDDDDVGKFARAINRLFCFRTCPCNRYFLKDDEHTVCAWCLLSSVAAEMETEFCCICHQRAAIKHMTKQTCCLQRLHQTCLDAWNRSRGGEAPCPMCRSMTILQ